MTSAATATSTGDAAGSAAPPAVARSWLRQAAPWIPIAVFVVLLAGVQGGSSGGPSYDPSSTSPSGAKALALLLAQIGPGVDQASGPPVPGSGGIAVVLNDRLNSAGDQQLTSWVKAGGTLVAADPGLVAQFAAPAREAGPLGFVAVTGDLPVDCAVPALAGVQTVNPEGDVALRLPAGATGCFSPSDGAYFLIVESLGSGNLVLLGGPDLWTNAHLGDDDNSVLAADLLAPRSTGSPVQWIVGPRAGGGHQSLIQLVPPRVKEGVLELAIAVLLFVLWRGRRLGNPVLEAPPVEVPGSELVVAVGNLLQKSGRLDDATAILRTTLRRGVRDQLGVPPEAGPDIAADVVAQRTGLARDMVLTTLAGPPAATEAELVTLARNANDIERHMAHAR